MERTTKLLKKTLSAFEMKKRGALLDLEGESLMQETNTLMSISFLVYNKEDAKIIENRLESIRNRMREIFKAMGELSDNVKEMSHDIELQQLLNKVCKN